MTVVTLLPAGDDLGPYTFELVDHVGYVSHEYWRGGELVEGFWRVTSDPTVFSFYADTLEMTPREPDVNVARTITAPHLVALHENGQMVAGPVVEVRTTSAHGMEILVDVGCVQRWVPVWLPGWTFVA